MQILQIRAVNKRIKCKNCETYFHNSCEKKKTKKCCENEEFISEKPVKSTQKDDFDQGQVNDEAEDKLSLEVLYQSISFENKLLVDLNKDLKNQVKDLQEENKVLKQKFHEINSKAIETPDCSIVLDTVKNIINESMTKFYQDMEKQLKTLYGLDIHKLSNKTKEKEITQGKNSTKPSKVNPNDLASSSEQPQGMANATRKSKIQDSMQKMNFSNPNIQKQIVATTDNQKRKKNYRLI